VSRVNPAHRSEEICGISALPRLCGLLGLNVRPGDTNEVIEAALTTVLEPPGAAQGPPDPGS
jgi:hypothetical protein